MPSRRNWDQAAAVIWPALTAAAGARKNITYSDLAPLILTNPLSVGRALGPVQTYCMESNLPPLTGLVIGKSTGLPGNGFIAWAVDDLEEGLEGVFRFPWAEIANPFVGFSDGQTEANFASALISDPDAAGDVYSKVKNRGVAQRIFRRALLECYNYSCCMCGNSFESSLEAAHLIPWGDCTQQQRLDVRNGLLLCSNHHRMFDAGEIAPGKDYKIEFYDPNGDDGTYSAIDRILSLDLHDRAIALPEDQDLAPSAKAIQGRRSLNGWS